MAFLTLAEVAISWRRQQLTSNRVDHQCGMHVLRARLSWLRTRCRVVAVFNSGWYTAATYLSGVPMKPFNIGSGRICQAGNWKPLTRECARV